MAEAGPSVAAARRWLRSWHAAVKARSAQQLDALLTDDVSFSPPTFYSPLHGKRTVSMLLRIVIETLQDFTYEREFVGSEADARAGAPGRHLCLEFKARIPWPGRDGFLKVQGVDMITLDATGSRMQRLEVMIRPHKALGELKKIISARMQEALQSSSKL